jgi:hypothetical protein
LTSSPSDFYPSTPKGDLLRFIEVQELHETASTVETTSHPKRSCWAWGDPAGDSSYVSHGFTVISVYI